MSKSKTSSIYNCSDYNGRKDVLFLINDTEADFRNSIGVTTYTKITSGKRVPKSSYVVSNNRKVFVFKGDNGIDYEIYSDYSAKVK